MAREMTEKVGTYTVKAMTRKEIGQAYHEAQDEEKALDKEGMKYMGGVPSNEEVIGGGVGMGVGGIIGGIVLPGIGIPIGVSIGGMLGTLAGRMINKVKENDYKKRKHEVRAVLEDLCTRVPSDKNQGDLK
jgi:hypothetical protein